MVRNLILALLLTIACTMRAQVTELSGHVYDGTNGEPLVGATVKVDGTNKATMTDIDGKFVLKNLTAQDKK